MAEEHKEAEETKKGGSKMLIIIIVVLVLLLGGGGAAAFVMMGKSDHEEGEEGAEGEEAPADTAGLLGAIYPMDTFIVNLGVKGSFLKTTLQLEFLEPIVPQSFEFSMPKVRDAIIRVLSNRRASEILTVEGKEDLRDDVKDVINETLGSEDVVQVYFTEFIVQ